MRTYPREHPGRVLFGLLVVVVSLSGCRQASTVASTPATPTVVALGTPRSSSPTPIEPTFVPRALSTEPQRGSAREPAPQTPTVPAIATAGTSGSRGQTALVNGTGGSGLVIRDKPGGTRVASANEKQTVIYLGSRVSFEKRDWQQIQGPDGTQGWTLAEFLLPQDSPITAFAVTGTGRDGLVIRDQPNGTRVASASETQLLLDLGERADIDGRTWQQVRAPDGTPGWALGQFLTALGAPTAPAQATRPDPTAPPREAVVAQAPPPPTARPTNSQGQEAPTEEAPDPEPTPNFQFQRSQPREVAPTPVPTPVPTATPRPIVRTPTPVSTSRRQPTPIGVAPSRDDDKNCSDYPSQRDAQKELRANPSDRYDLDRDRDGIACKDNPGPYDRTPVPRR